LRPISYVEIRANDPVKLVPVLGALPPGTPVAFEAAYGWGCH